MTLGAAPMVRLFGKVDRYRPTAGNPLPTATAPEADEARTPPIHVEAALSIDEMWAWLPLNLREPATVEAIGRRIKETVVRDVSPVIKVSVGAGTNRYLAKMASKMRKPDGLFIIGHRDFRTSCIRSSSGISPVSHAAWRSLACLSLICRLPD